MKVSLSTLVEILTISKSSLRGSTPKYILKRVQEVNDNRNSIFIWIMVIVLMIILVMTAVNVLLQGMLDEMSMEIVGKVVRPIDFKTEINEISVESLVVASAIKVETLDDQFIIAEPVLRKISSCDRSTECAEEPSEIPLDHTCYYKENKENFDKILSCVSFQTPLNKLNAEIMEEHMVHTDFK